MSPCCWPAATSNPTHTCSHVYTPGVLSSKRGFFGEKFHRVKRPTTTSQPYDLAKKKRLLPFLKCTLIRTSKPFSEAVFLRSSGGGGVRGSRKWQIWLVFFLRWRRILMGKGDEMGGTSCCFCWKFLMVFVLNGTHFLDHQISKKNIALFGLVMLWPLLVAYTQNHSTKMVKKVNKRWWFTTNGTCWWWIQIVMFVIVHPPTPPPQSFQKFQKSHLNPNLKGT